MKISAGPRGQARLDLSRTEKNLFRSLFSDAAVMLGGDEEEGASAPGGDDTEARLARMLDLREIERPTDPALLRLLPDVDPDDPERSAEFRRLTDFDLRESKLANLRIALHTLGASGRIELDRAAQQAWLIALTDLRLILAVRLGMDTEDDVEDLHAGHEDLSEHDAAMLTVYDVLSWVQERLTGVMLDALDDEEI